MSVAATEQPEIPSAGLGIHVRRPDFELSEEIPRHWLRGEPFATHVLNALSSEFPAGEAFFVRAVMHFADRCKDDAQLTAEIRAFAGQEGRHSHEHDRHLEMLDAQGYVGIARRNRILDKVLRWSNRRQPVTSLAATAGVEHLTAILARVVLDGDRMVHGMDPRMKPLWEWHALEEAEHKSVAYDVYLRASGSYALRVYMLAMNTIGMIFETLERVVYMLWKDGELFKWKTWRDGMRFLFGSGSGAQGFGDYRPRGILRDVGPQYFAWYRRDFHPSQHDDTRFIAEYQEQFGRGVARSPKLASQN